MKQNYDAVNVIRNFILCNGYKPGDRIPTQSELIEILNLSERTLREGINMLVQQGLLVPRGRAGTFLSDPKQDTVVQPLRWFYEVTDISDSDLINARIIMERSVIPEICNNRTTKDLLMLQSIIEKQSASGLPAETELELDKEFHLQLVRCSHNKALQIIGNLITLQLDLLYDRGLYPAQLKDRVLQHQEILDAVFGKNIGRAEQAVVSHVSACWDFADSLPENPLSYSCHDNPESNE